MNLTEKVVLQTLVDNLKSSISVIMENDLDDLTIGEKDAILIEIKTSVKNSVSIINSLFKIPLTDDEIKEKLTL